MSDIKLGDHVRYTGVVYVSDRLLESGAEGIVLEVDANVTWGYRVFFPRIDEAYADRQAEMFGLLCGIEELEAVNV